VADEEIIDSGDLAAPNCRACSRWLPTYEAAAPSYRQRAVLGRLYAPLTSSICHKCLQYTPHLLLQPSVLAKLKAKPETLQLKVVSGELSRN
jgi:hypothetical protein